MNDPHLKGDGNKWQEGHGDSIRAPVWGQRWRQRRLRKARRAPLGILFSKRVVRLLTQSAGMSIIVSLMAGAGSVERRAGYTLARNESARRAWNDMRSLHINLRQSDGEAPSGDGCTCSDKNHEILHCKRALRARKTVLNSVSESAEVNGFAGISSSGLRWWGSISYAWVARWDKGELLGGAIAS